MLDIRRKKLKNNMTTLMKEQINKAIEYLKSVSLIEPVNFRVEEVEGQRIVLSYKEEKFKFDYMWQKEERIYKEFILDNAFGEIISMKSFKS